MCPNNRDTWYQASPLNGELTAKEHSWEFLKELIIYQTATVYLHKISDIYSKSATSISYMFTFTSAFIVD